MPPAPLRRSPAMQGLALLAIGAMLATCGGDQRKEPTIALADCRLPKLATAARCGTLAVPENRSQVGGRKIDLFVAVLPANTLSPKPDPLLILAGGPGQSATSLAPFASRLVDVRRTRDLVLVDQRGTGRSAPLVCTASARDEDAADALDADPLPRAKECAAELAAAGIDAAQYTTEAFVADVEAVREALGYPRLNLWGGSYGTRVALEYLRRYGERVRSLVLDGAAPPALKIPLSVWTTREHALETLFSACEATVSCNRAHPDLRGTLDRIRDELGANGRDVTIVDPRTGERQSLRLTYSAVLAGLHPLTYLPELAVTLPEILERGAQGDWAPLAAVAQMVTSDFAEQTNVALHYSVTCADDVPRVDAQDRARIVGLRARTLAERALSVCDVWPQGHQPAAATLPVASDVPALLLSGALDPVTPPAYAEEVAKTLTNSKHVVAGGYGHIVSPHACAPRLIAAFVDSAGFANLPQRCIDHLTASIRPPLWPDHLAPVR